MSSNDVTKLSGGQLCCELPEKEPPDAGPPPEPLDGVGLAEPEEGIDCDHDPPLRSELVELGVTESEPEPKSDPSPPAEPDPDPLADPEPALDPPLELLEEPEL
jgi:hypothetical protein